MCTITAEMIAKVNQDMIERKGSYRKGMVTKDGIVVSVNAFGKDFTDTIPFEVIKTNYAKALADVKNI